MDFFLRGGGQCVEYGVDIGDGYAIPFIFNFEKKLLAYFDKITYFVIL